MGVEAKENDKKQLNNKQNNPPPRETMPVFGIQCAFSTKAVESV